LPPHSAAAKPQCKRGSALLIYIAAAIVSKNGQENIPFRTLALNLQSINSDHTFPAGTFAAGKDGHARGLHTEDGGFGEAAGGGEGTFCGPGKADGRGEGTARE